MKHKILMTLALLITAVGGAWAQDVATPVISGETEFYDEVTVTITCATSEVDIYYTLDGSNPKDEGPSSTFKEYKKAFTLTETTTVKAAAYSGDAWSAIAEVTFTKQTGPKVTWTAATKTGTFTMPAYDVEIAPIYAPVAMFATDGNLVLTPTAIEGIFAGTTDAIVKAGTVAMMGKTENPQGIVMYAVTSINQATAPVLSAFSATVPTAENIADEGADVLVWYYIQGANTPDGQEATAENTFNDSEICTTPIKVTVLPNKYDIQFNAANDNTIEAGKATVKVGDAAATVTEGKLEGVKMGTKVTINAKNGYKFRKVAVKKGGAATLATALENGATVVIAFKYRDDGTCTFTNNNGTFTFVSGTGQLGGGNGPKQLSVENGKLIFKGSGTNSFTDRWSWYGFQVTFDPTANTYEVWKGSDLDVASFTSISVNGTDITDQLSELK